MSADLRGIIPNYRPNTCGSGTPTSAAAAPDIFRFAEAMGRHTGEVDVYHLGRSGCSHTPWRAALGRQRQAASHQHAVYRRFYYYLTADGARGDLMHEQVDADETFITPIPFRKIRQGEYKPDPKRLREYWARIGVLCWPAG